MVSLLHLDCQGTALLWIDILKLFGFPFRLESNRCFIFYSDFEFDKENSDPTIGGSIFIA